MFMFRFKFVHQTLKYVCFRYQLMYDICSFIYIYIYIYIHTHNSHITQTVLDLVNIHNVISLEYICKEAWVEMCNALVFNVHINLLSE